MGIQSKPHKERKWNSLERDVWDLERNPVTNLFDSNYETTNGIIFKHKFTNQKVDAKVHETWNLSTSEEKIVGSFSHMTQVDLKGEYCTLRLRTKPQKLLMHYDFGPYTFSRKLSQNLMGFQPYLFIATNKDFNRRIYSMGNFLRCNEKSLSHARITMINSGKSNDVYLQNNIVKYCDYFTFNHLFYGKIFTNELQFGNTFNVLGTYKGVHGRLEISHEKQDKRDSTISEAKLSLAYAPNARSLVGASYHLNLKDKTHLAEVGASHDFKSGLYCKAKINSKLCANFFARYQAWQSVAFSLGITDWFGAKGDQPLVGRLPFAFNIGVKFYH